MVHPVIAEASDTDDPSDLPPLTLNGYTRLPKTEADIRDLLALAPANVLAAFGETDETATAYRNSEALVFFLRRAHLRGAASFRDALFGLLTERCQRYFRSAVRGFDPATREDVQQEILTDLARLVLAMDNSGDFLEARFLTYLKRETAQACGKMRKRLGRAPLIADMVDDAEGEDVFVANHRHEQDLAEADRARVREAVEALPHPLRELVLLRYFAGWQIGDERKVARDDQCVTLAKKYGVTPRTIQNWLGKAYAQMKAYWKDDQ